MGTEQERNAKYVHDRLMEPGAARLASYVAVLLRDGMLARGMAWADQKTASQEVAALGKKISVKCYKVKHMTPTFKMKFIMAQVPALAAGPAAGEEPCTIDDQSLQEMVQTALKCDPEAFLPTDFQGHQYEGPMRRAWLHRANQVGNVLRNLTKHDITNKRYKQWEWQKDNPTNVRSIVGEVQVQVPMPDYVQVANDLQIIDVYSSKVALESKEYGFHQGLIALAKRQHPQHQHWFNNGIADLTSWTTDGADFGEFASLLAVAQAPAPPPKAPAAAGGAGEAAAPGTAKQPPRRRVVPSSPGPN